MVQSQDDGQHSPGFVIGRQPLAFIKLALLTSQVTSKHFVSVSGSWPPQVSTQD